VQPADEVVVTGTAVLHRSAEDVPAFDALLRAGRTVVAGERDSGQPLSEFSVPRWAADRVTDEGIAGRLRRVAGLAPLPTRSGACVAVAAAAEGGLPSGEDLTVLVAGSNLALEYQYNAVRNQLAEPDRVRPSHIRDCLDTDVLGAIGEVLAVGGEGFTVGGASASGNLAVIQGIRLIQGGYADRCLVVAPVHELSPLEKRSFVLSGAMTTAVCLPFDRARSGFTYGQAAAAVLLESRSTARQRGVPILARLLGHGLRLDGRRGTAPCTQGQIAVISAALEGAGAAPGDVDYVNAHGTGSALGDEVETTSLHSVFGSGRQPLINSTKGLIGHPMAASGVVELVATVLQMRGGYCHPNPWLTDPLRDDLGFAGAETKPLRIGLALSTSFGTSGINTALLLANEDWPATKSR
jgi:malonyl-ACP decarboxylase